MIRSTHRLTLVAAILVAGCGNSEPIVFDSGSTGVGGAGGFTTTTSSGDTTSAGGGGVTTTTSGGGDGGGSTTTTSTGGVCTPGAQMACYSGPDGSEGVGICKAGIQTCNEAGTAWGPCAGEVVPALEDCATPVDEDCDGTVNQAAAGCVCDPGDTMPCYSGPQNTEGTGACKGGLATCAADGKGWGSCAGEITPMPETCQTPVDDDCDGLINEEGMGCLCAPGATAPCYEGPQNTAGVGACKSGVQTCSPDGLMYGPCVGQVLPVAESCNTPADDDCNGQVNENCGCVPNSTAPCYSGPAGTDGKGICKAGLKTCNAQGTGYGACSGEVLPQAEVCGNVVDEDCDGALDNGCTYTSCLALKQAKPATLSGEYTIDTDGAGPIPAVKVYCDMTTDGGGYTLVRFDDAALAADQAAYAAKCASVGMEVVVTRTKAHAQALFTWNNGQQANLLNIFPKFNGAAGIQNWRGVCKGATCGFWMTDNGNGDVGCTTFEPNGDNNTSYRIFRRNTGCNLQGNWNDQNNFVQIPGWVICSTNDK